MSQSLIAFRHELHQHPELSGNESETAKRVINYMKAFSPSRIIDQIGGHGVAVIYDFNQEGPTVMIRCELDALPIEESNSFSYLSKHKGVSHKCGHDGHMTIVAGLGSWLSSSPFDKGRVVLLFQPAEETGQGAKAVLDDPKFQPIKPDFVFALHNLPGHNMHQILWSPEQFCPTVQSIAITLQGKQAHAAEPENGINPSWAIAALIQKTQQLIVSDPNNPQFAQLTPVHITAGQKDYGISAGYGEVHLTIRTWTKQRMDQLTEQLTSIIKETTSAYQLKYNIEWFDYFPTVINNKNCNEAIKRSAEKAGFELNQLPTPCKFGEDFGWYTGKFPGAMFGLGSGLNTPALHHDDYDFPDELISTGTAMFKGIIEEILS